MMLSAAMVRGGRSNRSRWIMAEGELWLCCEPKT
jgi:hypothetical protein